MAVQLARMQQRRDTADGWSTANPVLADGELGYERVPGAITGPEAEAFKIGDGITPWNDLPYAGGAEPNVPDTATIFEEAL